MSRNPISFSGVAYFSAAIFSVAGIFAPASAASTPDQPPPVMNRWTGAISLSASYASGNTDRKSIAATADGELRHERDRWTLGALWNYAEDSSSVTDRHVLGHAKYDYFLDKKSYVLGQTSGEYDYNAGLDLRTTLGAGYGYQFREDEQWKLGAEAGLTFFKENYEDDSANTEYLAARLAYKAEWKLDDKWTASQVGELFPSLEKAEDLFARVDSKVRVALTGKMFAQLQWLYTWDNTPSPGRDRVDNLFVLGLGWTF